MKSAGASLLYPNMSSLYGKTLKKKRHCSCFWIILKNLSFLHFFFKKRRVERVQWTRVYSRERLSNNKMEKKEKKKKSDWNDWIQAAAGAAAGRALSRVSGGERLGLTVSKTCSIVMGLLLFETVSCKRPPAASYNHGRPIIMQPSWMYRMKEASPYHHLV